MLLLLARQWPDALDGVALVMFFALAFALPIFGYAIMVMDIRAYLRALRGVLVRVVHYFPSLPSWARYETPGCLRALGLSLPCTESDLRRAYRKLAEQTHPDRGGDRTSFLRLQRQFEESLRFLTAHEPEFQVDQKQPDVKQPDVGSR